MSLPEEGFHEIEVLLESAEEAYSENNRGAAFVRIKGEPRVLVLDPDPDDAAALADALDLQDIVVDVGGRTALPTNAADLERYDAVFLSNYPAYSMDLHQMRMLQDGTRDLGIGLGMIGGEFSFGAGGYYQTPVEEALPVDMDVKKDRAFPASAVLMVMDTSGSMGVIEDGREKIELAAEAACAVVDLLQPYDSVGLIASDPRPTSVCSLRRIENKRSVKRDIRSVRAGGGGIACYPSLSAAYEVLADDSSSIRHIILLADGSDCDEQADCVPLVGEMAKQRITVTAVAFGDGPHVPFLKDVAAAGGGQFYLTQFARDLKKIFTREALTMAKSALVEEPFQPRVADSTAVIQGVDWAAVPPLLGYVATSPKALARVPLVSHKDDPVFAQWQYGLGKSVAFTSDAKPRWAAHWLAWNGFTQFWGQAVRWSLRQLSSGVLYPQIRVAGDEAVVTVDAVAEDGSLLNGLTVRANVNLPDGGRRELVLEQTAPGRYEAAFAAGDSGSYVVGLSAQGADGSEARQTVGFAVAYPPDFADMRTEEAFLRSIAEQTGGRVLDDPEEVFVPPTARPRVPIDIWRSLLWLAACLLPLDVAVRRLVVRREDLEAFAQPVLNAARRLREQQPPDRRAGETMGRLLARRDAARGRSAQEERKPSVTPPRPPAAPRVQPPAGPHKPKQTTEATTSRLLEGKRRRRRGRR